LTRPLILLFLVCNACSTVPLPHTDLCVANAANKARKCYWMDQDFADDGTLKPGATPNYQPFSVISDVDKNVTIDPDSWALFKAYEKILREELAKCNSRL